MSDNGDRTTHRTPGWHQQTWTAQPINLAPPKPRRDNGLVNWRGIPLWLLSTVFRWS